MLKKQHIRLKDQSDRITLRASDAAIQEEARRPFK